MHVPADAQVLAMHREHAPSPAALDLVWTHCQAVCAIAEQLHGRAGPRRAGDLALARAGALLHDIGVYRLVDESGALNLAGYIRHGILGHELLAQAGLAVTLCRFASCHTGVGITREDVIRQRLPLPPTDYVAQTPEERLVMYADNFHTKSDPPAFMTPAAYAQRVARFGPAKVAAFAAMRAELGDPDLLPLSAAFGHRISGQLSGTFHSRMVITQLRCGNLSTTMRGMTTIGDGSPSLRAGTAQRRFFAQPLREFASAADPSGPLQVLQAGCLAPLRELDLGELADRGFTFSVSLVDDDQPPSRDILGQAASDYAEVFTGDLRTVPLPQRAFDIVYCGGLLERVSHVELVLDRLTSALRPGGLLLLRLGDRDSAWARLNRLLPGAARRAMWRNLHPGVPGPFPAIYEEGASERGIASYALLHGLVIDQRAAEQTLPADGGLSSTVRLTCAAIARLSGGRFSDRSDELLYVIRKPQDRFARVV